MKPASCFLAALLLSLSAAAQAPSPDPFYGDRLRAGVALYEGGQIEEARRELEVACFGFLEQPARLAECLGYRLLVELAAPESDEIEPIYLQLIEVESRFGGYSAAGLDQATRRELERGLVRVLPPSRLDQSPTFARAAEEARDEARRRRLAELPPKRRARVLREEVDAHPNDLDLRVELADLWLSLGESASAEREASLVLEIDPARSDARCVLAVARDRCEEILEALAACEEVATDLRFAEPLLRCQVEGSRWSEARDLLVRLEPTLRGEREIRRLQREVDRNDPAPAPPEGGAGVQVAEDAVPSAGSTTLGAPADDAPAEVAASDPPTSPDDGPRPETEPPASSPERTEAALSDSATLTRQVSSLRSRAAAVSELAQLDPLFEEALRLAELWPESREAQQAAAYIAYRSGRWQDAVRFYRAAEVGVEQPLARFFFAVSLFEIGNRAEAADILRPVAGSLPDDGFVRTAVGNILGPQR